MVFMFFFCDCIDIFYASFLFRFTLMGMWSEGNGLYVQLSQSSMGWQSFLYRQISHMKD